MSGGASPSGDRAVAVPAEPEVSALRASIPSAGHTPGPWELLPTETEGDLLGTTIVGSNLGGLVGMAMPWPTEIDSEDYRRVEANARLIAAAPELLEALEQIAWLSTNHGGWFEQDEFGEYVKLGSIAQAAIAKARGDA